MKNNYKLRSKRRFLSSTTFLVGLTCFAIPLSIVSCKTTSDYATVIFKHLDGRLTEQRIAVNKSFKEAGLSLPEFTYKHQTWYDELGNVFTADSKVTESLALKEDCAAKVSIDPAVGDIKVGGENVTFTATISGDPNQYDINDFEWKVIDESIVGELTHKTIELLNPKILDANRASVEIKAIDAYINKAAMIYFAPKEVYSGFKIELKDVPAYKNEKFNFAQTKYECSGQYEFECEPTYDLTSKDPSFVIEIKPLSDDGNIAAIDFKIDEEVVFTSKVVVPKKNKSVLMNITIPREKFKNDSSNCSFNLRSETNKIITWFDEISLPYQIFALDQIQRGVSTLQPTFAQKGSNEADFSLEGKFVFIDKNNTENKVETEDVNIDPYISFLLEVDLAEILEKMKDYKETEVSVSFKSTKKMAGVDYSECSELFELLDERTAVKDDSEHDKFLFGAKAISEEKAGKYKFSVMDGETEIFTTSAQVTAQQYVRIDIEIPFTKVNGNLLKIVPTKEQI